MHPTLPKLRHFLVYLGVWLLLSQLPALFISVPNFDLWPAATLATVMPTFLFGLLALSFYYVCRTLPLSPALFTRASGLHLLMAVVWAVVYLAALHATAWLVDWVSTATDVLPLIEARWPQLLPLGAAFYLGAIAFFYLVINIQSAHTALAEAATERLRAREAQLNLLKAQVHPHFLFNSLNTISALVTPEPGLARELCALLADFLRKSLTLGEHDTIPLADELALAKNYLDIEKLRLGERLTIAWDVAPQTLALPVPALLLQPLIENAITHGVATCVQGGTLTLTTVREGAMLKVRIGNPFDPEAPPRKRGGVGLANVSRRLHARYGKAAAFTTARYAEAFQVQLLLPLDEEAPDAAPP